MKMHPDALTAVRADAMVAYSLELVVASLTTRHPLGGRVRPVARSTREDGAIQISREKERSISPRATQLISFVMFP